MFKLTAILGLLAAADTSLAMAHQVPTLPGEFPFEAHSVLDRHAREIRYYLSPAGPAPLPIYLFVAGSGCESSFWRRPDGAVSGGYQTVLLEEARDRARVMVVEKPGVRLFDSTPTPGTAVGCSHEFNEEHTLERWGDALDAAVTSALELPGVNTGVFIAIGHSEGAISVALLASVNPRVTQLALLSGNGPSQLFDFVVNRPGREVEEVYRDYEYIRAHPDDTTRFFWGHPTRRWASFLRYSTPELLASTKAKVYLAQGTNDSSVPVQSFDYLVTDLLRRGRRFHFERIEGANHSLNLPGETRETGLRREFRKILDWAATQPTSSGPAPRD